MPGLRGVSYLEIDIEDSNQNTHTGIFEFREDLENVSNVAKQYLIGNSGQYLKRAYDIGDELIPADLNSGELENRRGYHVDGGAGVFAETITAKAGGDGVQWGDGSTDPNDPDDITRWDAAGCDLIAQRDILAWYISQSRTGSAGNCRLHVGEWTDGSYESGQGVFGKPLTLAIQEGTVSRTAEENTVLDVTIEGVWTAVFPDAEIPEADEVVKQVTNALKDR
jgi:hypothetical protein